MADEEVGDVVEANGQETDLSETSRLGNVLDGSMVQGPVGHLDIKTLIPSRAMTEVY